MVIHADGHRGMVELRVTRRANDQGVVGAQISWALTRQFVQMMSLDIFRAIPRCKRFDLTDLAISSNDRDKIGSCPRWPIELPLDALPRWRSLTPPTRVELAQSYEGVLRREDLVCVLLRLIHNTGSLRGGSETGQGIDQSKLSPTRAGKTQDVPRLLRESQPTHRRRSYRWQILPAIDGKQPELPLVLESNHRHPLRGSDTDSLKGHRR